MSGVYHVFHKAKRKVNHHRAMTLRMSMDYGSLSVALHAAAGEDTALVLELRQALVDSAHRQIDLMSRSRCDANWQYSCLRLKGLAASFEAVELLALAEEAVEGAPGDPVVLRRLGAALEEIRQAPLD
jgi:hypothetical protein